MNSKEFFELCKSGTAWQVKNAIRTGAKINTKDEQNRTALMVAARWNRDSEVASVLLGAGADVNAREMFDFTALMYAAGHNTIKVVNTLLQAGAEVNAKEKNGMTVLMYAVKWSCRSIPTFEIVNVLLDAGAEVNARDKYGTTALMVAASSCDAEVVTALLRGGAEANARDKYGTTALMYARTTAVIKALIGAGSDVDARHESGATVLMLSASNGLWSDDIKLLLEAGADVNARDRNGMTALMYAARGSKNLCAMPWTINVLAEAGSEIDARDKYGMTALMWAAKVGAPNVVNALIASGADINAKLESNTTVQLLDVRNSEVIDIPFNAGTTALMMAALNNDNPGVIKLLLDSGLDINARDNGGRTALMLAAEWSTSRIINILLSVGADIAVKDNEGKRAANYARENRSLKSRYVRTRLKGGETGLQRHIDEKSDERNNPAAQFNLGQMYEKGEGVGQGHEEAVKWYREAAGQGDAEARSRLYALDSDKKD